MCRPIVSEVFSISSCVCVYVSDGFILLIMLEIPPLISERQQQWQQFPQKLLNYCLQVGFPRKPTLRQRSARRRFIRESSCITISVTEGKWGEEGCGDVLVEASGGSNQLGCPAELPPTGAKGLSLCAPVGCPEMGV